LKELAVLAKAMLFSGSKATICSSRSADAPASAGFGKILDKLENLHEIYL
jgi:hypothetical protein